MPHQKKALYVTQQLRGCEHMARDELGFLSDDLMLRAGTAAFYTLKTHFPDIKTIAVFCGGGHNAGDAYVLARLAHHQGFTVIIYPLKSIEELPSAAKQAALAAVAAGVLFSTIEDSIDTDIELVVDGLLGIGLLGHVSGPIAQAIHLINDSGLPVLSLDVPSGLDADTGRIMGVCVQASVTVSFIADTVGLFTLDGPDYCGKIVSHSLQLDHCLASFQPAAYVLDDVLLQGIMQPRRKNSHKGLYGHVLIIGGGEGMPGAVHLAAEAAFRIGAGAVTIATSPKNAGHGFSTCPEVMIHVVEDVSSLRPLFMKATVCVLGPGLGTDAWARSLFDATISAQLPLVIDASALRLLGLNSQHDDNWVLTPHPGEAAGLLGCATTDIQANRCKSATLIQQQYGGSVVLKGVGTIVNTAEHHTYICTSGNPGMATAGMGDVLSGVIGGLLAQGLSLADAAKLGVWLHAHAADEAVKTQGERGLMASDLMPYLRRLINKCL